MLFYWVVALVLSFTHSQFDCNASLFLKIILVCICVSVCVCHCVCFFVVTVLYFSNSRFTLNGGCNEGQQNIGKTYVSF